ncbi:MAG: transketolase family protein [Pirellulales bacterium]|nr:transketolase family protein [Pirellulales bacterium]
MASTLKGEKTIPTRHAYGETLVELGKLNDRVVVFEADISKSTQTYRFAEAFPDRFFNVGVAEQNMMAMAAGAAICGKIAFVSTYAVFGSMRACEQMRTSVAYPKLNVNIAVSHAGLTAYDDGVTHQAIEDLGIVRSIPNMTVVQPCDAPSTRKAVMAAAKIDGPVYLRLTRIGMPILYDAGPDFEIGKAIRLRRGNDVTIVAIGDMVFQALDAAEQLAIEGIGVDLLDMHTIKPLDQEALLESVMRTGAVVTAEDHNVVGGLGSAVAETLGEHRPTPMTRIGLQDTFAESGAYDDLLRHYGMDARHIIEAARKVMGRKK